MAWSTEVLEPSPWLFVILWQAGSTQARRQQAANSADSAATPKAKRLGYLCAPSPLAEQVAMHRPSIRSAQAMGGAGPTKNRGKTSPTGKVTSHNRAKTKQEGGHKALGVLRSAALVCSLQPCSG